MASFLWRRCCCFSLCALLIFVSPAAACDRCVHQSAAAFFPSDTPAAGSCGYGAAAASYGQYYFPSAGSPKLYRSGVGCGACFQIRCTDRRRCTTAGTKVVLTDQTKSNRTDFIAPASALAAMALPGMAPELKKLAVLDIEYRRVPCEYGGRNLSIRVEPRSHLPSSLAIEFLFQGGQTDIVAVDVAEVGSSSWRFLTRDRGPSWSTRSAPAGPLQLRLVVTGGYDGKWVWAEREVLPAAWVAGEVYDTGVQISDIAQEGCFPCDTADWK